MVTFLETIDGELVNVAEIAHIEAPGVKNQGETAQARLRDGEHVCLLKYEMEDIKDMLASYVPAAPGFYVITVGREKYAIVAWRRMNYGFVPVTLNYEINADASDTGIVYPNGQVEDTRHNIFKNEEQWEKYTLDTMREQYAKETNNKENV